MYTNEALADRYSIYMHDVKVKCHIVYTWQAHYNNPIRDVMDRVESTRGSDQVKRFIEIHSFQRENIATHASRALW